MENSEVPVPDQFNREFFNDLHNEHSNLFIKKYGPEGRVNLLPSSETLRKEVSHDALVHGQLAANVLVIAAAGLGNDDEKEDSLNLLEEARLWSTASEQAVLGDWSHLKNLYLEEALKIRVTADPETHDGQNILKMAIAYENLVDLLGT